MLQIYLLRDLPDPNKEHLSEFVETLPDTVDHAALIFEPEGGYVGKKVILDMSKHTEY